MWQSNRVAIAKAQQINTQAQGLILTFNVQLLLFIVQEICSRVSRSVKMEADVQNHRVVGESALV